MTWENRSDHTDASAPPLAPRIAGVILAAGRSRRMGDTNKLLAPVAGVPMVRRVAAVAIEVALDPVLVVLGHDAAAVRQALEGLPVRFVLNADYAEGIGSSVRAGVRAVAAPADGVMILLGDMPWIGSADLRVLLQAFNPEGGGGICVPLVGGQRGNPVLWAARYFSELRALEGDVGARDLLARYGHDVRMVHVTGDSVLRDIDTPAALAALRNPEG